MARRTEQKWQEKAGVVRFEAGTGEKGETEEMADQKADPDADTGNLRAGTAFRSGSVLCMVYLSCKGGMESGATGNGTVLSVPSG